jgi:hypothetical protein
MKPLKLLYLGILILLLPVKAIPGNCDFIVYKGDFSNASGWTQESNSGITIKNGVCDFSGVLNGQTNRIYRDLGVTLSDNYWKAECSYTITRPNPEGNGISVHIMAITNGNKEYEKAPEGIEVFLNSDSPMNNALNDWYFGIGSNQNISFVNSQSRIYVIPEITTYFIRLERASVNQYKLSVFSDPEFSKALPGTPVLLFTQNKISGLNTLQHATVTVGYPTRLINGSIDNDFICQSEKPVVPGQEKNNQLRVYPTFTRGNVRIEYDNGEVNALDLRIVNVEGKIVLRRDLEFSEFEELDLSVLSDGLYFVYLVNREIDFVRKIVIFHYR